MKRFIGFLVILSIFFSDVKAQDEQGTLRAFVEAEMSSLHILGASVAILRDGNVHLTQGYGLANLETKAKVTPTTKFQIGSTTKPFTSMAVMILVDDHKLSLDEYVTKYLSWLPTMYKDVTIRQLLSHTSGVNRDVRTGNVDNFTLAEFQKRFTTAPESFPRAERWEYSNNGYVLLSMLIETVSRRPYGSFLRERIFLPLRMKHTSYMEPYGTDKDRAIGYEWDGNRYLPAPYFHGGYGGGGIVSTAADMARWAQALEKRKLLTAASYNEIWTNTKLRDGRSLSFEFRGEQSGYGLGWFLMSYKGHKLFTHGGTVSGFSGQIHRFVDDKLAIVVLTNCKSGSDRIGYAEVLANMIADRYLDDIRLKAK